MRTEKFDEVLDQCLTMMQAGASIDDCVVRYPQHADELRAQLQTAQTLWDAKPTAQPEPTAQAKGRSRLLTAVGELQQNAPPRSALWFWPIRGLRSPIRLGQTLPAVVALLVLGGAAIGVSAATGQGPLGALLSPGSDANEAQVLGTVEAVACTDATNGTVTIDGVDVLITSDTELGRLTCPDITVGMVLSVEAIDDGGILTASEIEFEDDGLIDGDDADEDDGDGDNAGDTDEADEGDEADEADDADEGDEADEDGDDEADEDGDDDADEGDEPRTEIEDGECELRGPITSLDPLVINGITIDASSAEEVRGDLTQAMADGAEVRVKGDFVDGICIASKIEVHEGADDGDDADDGVGDGDGDELRTEIEDGECELRGPITSLDPLVINGITIDASSAEKVRGDLAQAMADGTEVRVKGDFVDGICIASEIRVHDEDEDD